MLEEYQTQALLAQSLLAVLAHCRLSDNTKKFEVSDKNIDGTLLLFLFLMKGEKLYPVYYKNI